MGNCQKMGSHTVKDVLIILLSLLSVRFSQESGTMAALWTLRLKMVLKSGVIKSMLALSKMISPTVKALWLGQAVINLRVNGKKVSLMAKAHWLCLRFRMQRSLTNWKRKDSHKTLMVCSLLRVKVNSAFKRLWATRVICSKRWERKDLPTRWSRNVIVILLSSFKLCLLRSVSNSCCWLSDRSETISTWFRRS